MKYTVTWSAEAERRLANLWLSAMDRNAVARAANQIDQELQRDPQRQGESRTGRTSIYFAKPLGVFFRVDETDRKVIVLTVWDFDTHEEGRT